MNKDKMELEESIRELESLSPSETAIKTVLQALENSIPKKKIEDKYKRVKKQYKEEVEKNSIKAFILKCQIEILQELLGEKQYE